jgi:hypothetical protein
MAEDDDDVPVPANLAAQVRARFAREETEAWDDALWSIAQEHMEDEDEA